MHFSNFRKCSVRKEHSAIAVRNSVHFCQNKCSNALNKNSLLFLLRKLRSVSKNFRSRFVKKSAELKCFENKLCKMYVLFIC